MSSRVDLKNTFDGLDSDEPKHFLLLLEIGKPEELEQLKSIKPAKMLTDLRTVELWWAKQDACYACRPEDKLTMVLEKLKQLEPSKWFVMLTYSENIPDRPCWASRITIETTNDPEPADLENACDESGKPSKRQEELASASCRTKAIFYEHRKKLIKTGKLKELEPGKQAYMSTDKAPKIPADKKLARQ